MGFRTFLGDDPIMAQEGTLVWEEGTLVRKMARDGISLGDDPIMAQEGTLVWEEGTLVRKMAREGIIVWVMIP